MLGFIKRCYEPIRKGNAYRMEKYGPQDTFAESYEKARKIAKEYRNSLPRATQSSEERNVILRHAATWELWSGSRFIREENPIQQMAEQEYRESCWSKDGDYRIPKNEGYTARSCPVTGDYKKV
jgi:hypothetical protein